MAATLTAHIPSETLKELSDRLAFLYGPERSASLLPRVKRLLLAYLDGGQTPPPHAGPLTERDVVLITYPDQVQEEGEKTLRSLENFLSRHLGGIISSVHVLPFFPSSSDGGFSVMDYRQINPHFGTWEDVELISRRFRLMMDAVINHISSQSKWFQDYLECKSPYDGYFITVDPKADLSAVVRPRDLPLLTPVQTARGPRHVWTTFSADQIDLNFGNPEVLLDIIDLLLSYIHHGAQIIRLDAAAFLWKDPGTSSIHLPQTHHLIKLMRSIIDFAAPWVLLITETNVPHKENISYFGDGSDEAHLVYNFALPPLVMHTFLSGDSTRLTEWADDLQPPSSQTAFLNFLASHDGIGLRPADGLLTEEEIEKLVAITQQRGGRISYRAAAEGQHRPYELNISYADAIAGPEEWDGSAKRAITKFISSQAIMLSIAGLPAIYFHSLFGSRNDYLGLEKTGKPRAINREKFRREAIERELADPKTIRSRIFSGYRKMLRIRRKLPAFSPYGAQKVLALDPAVFAILRTSPNTGRRLLCLHEISGRPARLNLERCKGRRSPTIDWISGETMEAKEIRLEPYQVRWIEWGRRAG